MKPSTARDYRERILRTLAHIQEHLDDDLDLGALASVAAFSPFHFHRIFRGMVGEGVGEHVRRLRLERAARNLKHGAEPVMQIALEAGFDAHESFTRAFNAMFGTSPSSYRAAHKPAPDSPSGTHLGDVTNYRVPDYGEPLAVEIRQLPPVQVVYIRHTGPYSEVGSAWGRLMSWAGMKGLLGPGVRMLGVVYDDPDVTPGGKIRYEAALAVTHPVQPEGEIGVRELPGGAHAVFTHRGPYDKLGETYARFFGGWLPGSGREPRDAPAFEEYLNSPMNTAPENLETRIHVPLAE